RIAVGDDHRFRVAILDQPKVASHGREGELLPGRLDSPGIRVAKKVQTAEIAIVDRRIVEVDGGLLAQHGLRHRESLSGKTGWGRGLRTEENSEPLVQAALPIAA